MVRCGCWEKRPAEPGEDTRRGRRSSAADYCVKGIICQRHCPCGAAVGPDVLALPPGTDRE